MWTLSWGMWNLVPWEGIEPRTPAWRARRLSHWAATEVPVIISWVSVYVSLVNYQSLSLCFYPPCLQSYLLALLFLLSSFSPTVLPYSLQYFISFLHPFLLIFSCLNRLICIILFFSIKSGILKYFRHLTLCHNIAF